LAQDVEPIPLSRPEISEEDIQAVVAVLRSSRLSLGPKLQEFESALASFVSARYAIAVSSGTAGLHLCMEAAGIRPGDEVITSPFSFVASANCILYVGAKPVFVDIDPCSLNLDVTQVADKIREGTKVLLPIHVFGRPCEMTPLLEMGRAHGLFVLEDACEAVGAQYKGKAAGTLGHAGVFAFYPNKQITTGEGGMIVTGDEEFALICRSLRNQGRGLGSGWLEHVRLGYNFRMTEMQAALGLSQLRRISEFMARRAQVAAWYHEFLKDCKAIRLPAEPPVHITVSWFVYVVILRDEFTAEERNRVLAELHQRRIECSNYFPPIHLQPYFRERFGYRPGHFPVTERVASRTIALPFHSRLSRQEVERVASTFRSVLGSLA
jgi:perosamine synthetase